MHGSLNERHPGLIPFGRIVPIDVAVTNGSEGSPETVVIFRIKHRNQGIIRRLCDRRKQTRIPRDVSSWSIRN